jgi:cell division protein FtsN
MNEYLLLVLQLVLFGATGLLYFSFKRTQKSVTTGGLQAEEIVELQSAMNELLDELQELATRANLQLTHTTSQAQELREEIDQRTEKLEQLNKAVDERIQKLEQLNQESARAEIIMQAAKPEEPEPVKPLPLRMYQASIPAQKIPARPIAARQEEASEISRGERELLYRLQNWQKK